MKKVIDGKVYNTETAELIASWSNHRHRSDYGWAEADLYKTKKGAWFLHGEGGPSSDYCEKVGPDEYKERGNRIIAMTPTEALAWCEGHGIDADTIAEHFDVDEA